MLIDGLGCWLSWREGFQPPLGLPALFLDRDDVLLADPGYLHSPAHVKLLPAAAEVVDWANQRGIPAILVTNQSGIARGFYDWQDFHAVNARMSKLLAQHGAWLDGIVACAWHANGLPPLNCGNHPWRKPEPGMLLAVKAAISTDLSRSWMVGDRESDVEAAHRAGLRGAIRVSDKQIIKQIRPPNEDDSFVVHAAGSMWTVLDLLPDLYDRDGSKHGVTTHAC